MSNDSPNDRPVADASNSSANQHAPYDPHRSSATTSSSNARSIVRRLWLLAALSFLFTFNRNLTQSSAQSWTNWGRTKSSYHEYKTPVEPNDDLWLDGALQYDYLVLNVMWPVTLVQKARDRAERGLQQRPELADLEDPPFWIHHMGTQLLEPYVQQHGYRFVVHGLWAALWGEWKMGATRVR